MSDELKEKAVDAAKTYFGTNNLDVHCIPEHDAFLDAYELGHDALAADFATVTAERDRLKRLVESARVIHLDNHYQIVQTCGDFILFDDVDKFVSRHDTVLEAFEAIPNSES